MPHEVLQRPSTVFPGEAEGECPEAVGAILELIQAMQAEGPNPLGYGAENLGQGVHGLWQINLKVQKRQVRILYAPDGDKIILFRIHKKSSAAEQRRAYAVAGKRKAEYEKIVAEAKRLAKKAQKKK